MENLWEDFVAHHQDARLTCTNDVLTAFTTFMEDRGVSRDLQAELLLDYLAPINDFAREQYRKENTVTSFGVSKV